MGKKFTDKQIERLVLKGATTKLKGFKVDDEKVEGVVKLNEAFELTFAPSSPRQTQTQTQTPMPACPKCGKGTLIRGNTSYGCSEWKSGCDFRFTFENIKTIANGRPLTKDLVLEIIKGDIPEQERSKANN